MMIINSVKDLNEQDKKPTLSGNPVIMSNSFILLILFFSS